MIYFYLVTVTGLVHTKSATFTYHATERLPRGALVRVPVGRSAANGVVMKEVAKPTFATKPITTRLQPEAVWPDELLTFAQWISSYYATHLGLVLQSMLPAGLHKKRRPLKASTTKRPERRKKDIQLTVEQNQALAAITASAPDTAFLLHGVPGSGKTQVYMEAAQQTVASDQSVIVLVPEIALTTQLIAEFANYFSDVVVIHSGMTEAERHQTWQRILTTRTPMVVVGPRSALFSPLANIGLIIIDECHEQTFKQDRAPRYHAVYAARTLTKLHNAKLILGSATPGVTELHLAQQGRMQLLELPQAIQPLHNEILIIPHKNREEFTRHRFISNTLIDMIEKAVGRGEQALVFHNRRGTAPAVLCEACGWQAECPQCGLPLTYHGDQMSLRCHSCNFVCKIMHVCPQCHAPTIVFKGIGTKLIESELRRLFPRAVVARFDTDNTKEEQLQSRYQELYDGHIDILVGTQILAKGLDLPQIAVVGVLQADAGLGLPDFSSRERAFQLLYQVSGRAGRGSKAGAVLLQTYLPDHEIITLAAAHDFATFYQNEIAYRQKLKLPPFYFLLKLSYAAKTEPTVVRATKTFAQKICSDYPNVLVLGPAPAFREQQAGMHHWQIVVKAKQRVTLQKIVGELPAKWQYDLDPVSLL